MKIYCRKCRQIFSPASDDCDAACPQGGARVENPRRVGPGVVLGDFLIVKIDVGVVVDAL